LKLVYIAGPYRAKDNWGIKCNVHRSAELALKVWNLGAAAISPHLNTADFQYAAPDNVWLEGDLEILSRCDAVMLLPNWLKSSGTRAEVEFAIARRIPVFEDLYFLENWLASE
jgi:nucleoside 2-deoxyribosyltransferase